MSEGSTSRGSHPVARKRGTIKWHVYTFIADRPIRSECQDSCPDGQDVAAGPRDCRATPCRTHALLDEPGLIDHEHRPPVAGVDRLDRSRKIKLADF
jgi:hypothetical protein